MSNAILAVMDAGTGARTRMGLPPRDFKSLASTYFATPAEMAKGSGISAPLRSHFRERETGLEPATPTLARLCSTN